MKNVVVKVLFAALVSLCSLNAPVRAGVIVDRSVDTIGLVPSFNASNVASAQNFLFDFTLSSATTLTGADIYSSFANSASLLGSSVVIKFRNSISNSPDTVNLYTLNSTISAIDTDGALTNPSLKRLHADFAPTTFSSGTYFFGMSGVTEIGLELNFGSPGQMFQLNGDNILFNQSPVAAAFRLFDNTATVPEPATWAIMLVVGGIGIASRRRQRGVAP